MTIAFKRISIFTICLAAAVSVSAASSKGKMKVKEDAKAEQPSEKKSASGALTIAKVGKKADFDRDILPILRQSCLACHNRTTTKAGLILETPEDILKGGDSGKGMVPKRGSSSLILQVAAHQKDPVMPPKGNKASASDLTPEQLGLLKAWIDQGAKGEVHREVAIDWQPLPAGLNPIYAVAVSPDGQYAACGRANQIHIYHIPTGRLVERLNDPELQRSGLYSKQGVAHRDMVYSLAFSPDGSLLASGSYREVKLWQRPVDPQKLSLTFDEKERARCVAISPDGNWLATGHADGKIRLHEIQSGKLKKTLSAHKGSVSQLVFSPTGDWLASAGEDQALVIWKADKWKTELRLDGTNFLRTMAWTADGLRVLTSGEDKIIRVWALPGVTNLTALPTAVTNAPHGSKAARREEPGKSLILERELKGHEGVVTALCEVQSTNQFILSAGTDGSVRLWDLVKGGVIRSVQHGGTVTALASSPNGKRFASSGTNNITRIWQTDDGKQLAEIKGDTFLRDAIGARERAQSLAVGEVDYRKKQIESAEKEIKAVEERTKKAKESLTAADKTFGEKKKAFDDASNAKTVAEKELSDIESPLKKVQLEFDAAQKSLSEVEGALKAAKEKSDADSKSLAAKLEDERAGKSKTASDAKIILDLVAAGLKPKLQPATDKVTNAEKARVAAETEFKNAERGKSIAENEQQLAGKADENARAELTSQQAELKSAEQGKLAADAAVTSAKAAAVASERPARALAFLSDGLRLASAGDDGLLHTWNAETGGAFANYGPSTNAVRAIATGPAGLLATLDEGGSVVVWELQQEWKLARAIGNGAVGSPLVDRVNAIAFSPDGKLLASGGGEPSRDGEIKVWNVADGASVNQFRAVHSDTVLALEYSPDGKFIASGAADRFMKVINAKKGNVLKTFEGHTHHVYGVTWKADGRTLASAGGDKVVKIWDFISGDRKKNVEGYGKEVTSAHFIGISDQIVTTAGDNRVRIIKEDGGEVKNLGAGDYMQASAVTPDGKIIIAGGQDSVLMVWTDLSKEPQRFKPDPAPTPVVANR